MVAIARRKNPRLGFAVASMLRLPVRDAAWAGVVAAYSIIHLNPVERAQAFAEFARTLAPDGLLLVSFHVDGPGFAPGEVNHLHTFLGHPVDMDGYFLDPSVVTTDLVANGFRVQARLDREPIAGSEFASRRCYILPAERYGRRMGHEHDHQRDLPPGMAEQLELAHAGVVSFGHRPFLTEVEQLESWRPDVAIVGAPFDIATTNRPGARFGPRAIRATAYEPGTYHLDLGLEIFDWLEVVDFGDAYCPHGQTEISHANIRERVHADRVTRHRPGDLGR